jgi:D(-)-tartrate dehydratase
MRITAVKEWTVDLSNTISNASISFNAMTASAVLIETDVKRAGKPLVGLAFDSIGRYGHGALLRERFIPRLLSAPPSSYAGAEGCIDPHRVWALLMTGEKPGGHGERGGAVGLLDAALWDLAAKYNEEPLWSLLARMSVRRNTMTNACNIQVYASGGHYHASDDCAKLCNDIRHAMSKGHRRFKIKIGGSSLDDDRVRIERALAVLESGMTLAVDANGAFDRDLAARYIGALAQYPIAWIEEPVPPLDFELCRDVVAESPLPIATGENLFSRDDARNLLRYAGLRADRDLLQFDISLSYGLVEYLLIVGDLEQSSWHRRQLAPHAGHLFAMHCVSGLELGLAEVPMDSTGLFSQITDAIPLDDGVATLSQRPGVGFEGVPAFTSLFSALLN